MFAKICGDLNRSWTSQAEVDVVVTVWRSHLLDVELGSESPRIEDDCQNWQCTNATNCNVIKYHSHAKFHLHHAQSHISHGVSSSSIVQHSKDLVLFSSCSEEPSTFHGPFRLIKSSKPPKMEFIVPWATLAGGKTGGSAVVDRQISVRVDDLVSRKPSRKMISRWVSPWSSFSTILLKASPVVRRPWAPYISLSRPVTAIWRMSIWWGTWTPNRQSFR